MTVLSLSTKAPNHVSCTLIKDRHGPRTGAGEEPAIVIGTAIETGAMPEAGITLYL